MAKVNETKERNTVLSFLHVLRKYRVASPQQKAYTIAAVSSRASLAKRGCQGQLTNMKAERIKAAMI